jgi:hypothetical protein
MTEYENPDTLFEVLYKIMKKLEEIKEEIE